jgi:hypothetical protein
MQSRSRPKNLRDLSKERFDCSVEEYQRYLGEGKELDAPWVFFVGRTHEKMRPVFENAEWYAADLTLLEKPREGSDSEPDDDNEEPPVKQPQKKSTIQRLRERGRSRR